MTAWLSSEGKQVVQRRKEVRVGPTRRNLVPLGPSWVVLGSSWDGCTHRNPQKDVTSNSNTENLFEMIVVE